MWNLELHIEHISSGNSPVHNPNGEAFKFWHKIESVEVTSEKMQWETLAEWKIKHNLKFYKHHYFICLSRLSEGSNITDEELERIDFDKAFGPGANKRLQGNKQAPRGIHAAAKKKKEQIQCEED